MKALAISFISLYQKVFSPVISMMIGVRSKCRYEVSCSSFAKESIKKYGVLVGLAKSVKRLLSCQPFYSL